MSERCKKHPSVEMEALECPRCLGEGSCWDEDPIEPWGDEVWLKCYACNGKGKTPYLVCDFCEEEARDREEEFDRQMTGEWK